jgi:xanthine/uracil permease
VTLAAHAVIYLALTDLLFRTVLRRWRTPTAQRVGVFLLVGLGSVLPFFVEAALGAPAATARWLYCLNPFALGMPRFGEEGEMLVVVVVGAVVLLAYLRVMARGYRELKEVAAANRRAKAPPAA